MTFSEISTQLSEERTDRFRFYYNGLRNESTSFRSSEGIMQALSSYGLKKNLKSTNDTINHILAQVLSIEDVLNHPTDEL